MIEQLAAGHLVSAAAILLLAYFVRGITGVGSGLIAVPLLALFLPLKFAVPLVLLLDFTASVVMSGFNSKRVRWAEIAVLLPFGALGVVLGTTLLTNLPPKPMLITLAILVFVFSLRSLLNLHGNKVVSRGWAVPAALTGGTVGALFGTGGPPYIIYLTHRIREKSELRASFSALFMFDGLMRIISFLIAGLLMTAHVWLAYLAALPLMLGALYLGGRVHVGLAPAQITRLVGVLLLVSSVTLLTKALNL